MMKHLVYFIIVTQLALCGLSFGQINDTSKIKLSVKDSLISSDSLKITERETVYVKKVDTVRVIKPAVDSSSVNVKEVEKNNLTDIDYWVEGINFFSILKFFIILFTGVGLSKLIDFLKDITILKKIVLRFPGFPFYIKALIWLVLGYNIFLMITANSSDIMLFIFIAFISVIFISVIPFSKNLVGGFYLSLLKPFSAKDYIIILPQKDETQRIRGTVTSITWRITELETDEGTKLIIPNSVFLDSVIENRIVEHSEKLVKIVFSFPMKYESSLILQNLFEAAISSPYFYNKNQPKVSISSIDVVNQIVTYQVEVYTINGNTEVEMINYLNHQVLAFTENILSNQ